MKKPADRTAIVTGAGGGIGGAIAKVLAEEGARVACAEVDATTAEATAKAIAKVCGEAIVCHNDVSIGSEAETVVRATLDAFGAVSILVNCASVVTQTCSVMEFSEEDWDRAFAVNLKSIFLMCKHAVPAMIEAGGENIVNVAFQLGHVGLPGESAYCTTKGGTLSMTRVLALDHADQNIRVNSLSPGTIATQRGIKQYGSLKRMQELRAPPPSHRQDRNGRRGRTGGTFSRVRRFVLHDRRRPFDRRGIRRPVPPPVRIIFNHQKPNAMTNPRISYQMSNAQQA